MDWDALLTTVIAAGGATTFVGLASLRWLEKRAATYIDTTVIEKIRLQSLRNLEDFKRENTKKIEELKSDLSAKVEQLKGNITTQVEFRKFELPAYKELWAALGGVKISGDALWDQVSFENLTAFRTALLAAERNLHGLAPLLPEESYDELAKLIEEFQKFEVGKLQLTQLRNYDLQGSSTDEYVDGVQLLIHQNGQRREKYNELLKKAQDRARAHLRQPIAD